MSLLDLLTGGENKKAENSLQQAQQLFANIQAPTAAQLTLPELQKYVQAGILTPAQAQLALQGPNALNNVSLDQNSMTAEEKALSQLQEVAADNGLTPEMKAQLTAALNQTQTQEQGANGSILDQMAQRGIPTSLMGTAAQLANNGQQSQNANLSATQAAGQAEANAISAMQNSGNLAGQISGQKYNADSAKAAAQNAINQWNASATNSSNLANAGMQQTANEYNTQNKQNVSNANVGQENQRTQYNAQVPETVFNNQMQKAGGQAGVNQAQSNQATQAGNQQMGLYGALIGAGANAMAPAAEGAIVPGEAAVPGDSKENDTVHAMLSPGEVVVPRSIAPHPEAVKRFVQSLMHGKPATQPAHPDDVHSVLEALSRRRQSDVGSSRG